MTLLITGYKTKKDLKASAGQRLVYQETSAFGPEYVSDGTLLVIHRPRVSGMPGREFSAKVTMKNGLISKVE